MTPLQSALAEMVRGSRVKQSVLAKRTGYSQKHISQMLTGIVEGSLTAWQELLDAAEVGPDVRTWRPKPGRKVGPFMCDIKGCTATPLKHIDSFAQHLNRVHNFTLREYRELLGDPKPMTERELAKLVVEVKCPDCPQTYSTELGHRWPRQALIAHQIARHGALVR